MNIKEVAIERFNDAKRYRESYCFSGASIDTWFSRTYNMANNIHDPNQVQNEFVRSGINMNNFPYYQFAKIKVDAACAFVDTTYSHAVSQPFILEPTRNPNLSNSQKLDVSISVASLLSKQLSATGLNYSDVWNSNSKSPNSDLIKSWLKAEASKMKETHREFAKIEAQAACKFRADFIADQLDAGGWNNAWSIIVRNLMAEPYTALCARENKTIIKNVWKGSKVERKILTVPSFRAIDPRNLYLSPDATSAQDGAGVTELTKRTVSELISMLNLNSKTIDKTALNEAIVIAKNNNQNNGWLNLNTLSNSNVYSLIHQGIFSGDELSKVGRKGLIKNNFYNATIEICENKLIRIEVLPYVHNNRNYYTAQHNKSTSSYASDSILTKLFHIQNQINLTTLIRDRNLYMSSGDALIVHASYFNRAQDLSIMPFSRNMAANNATAISGRGVEQINTQAQYQNHNAHIEWLKRQGDEISGVVSGLSGVARSGLSRTTLGGAVLDQSAAERILNVSIINLDKTLIEPMIMDLDSDNLQWEDIPKEYLRGDVVVVGKGITGLRESELKSKLITEALPLAMQANQAGKVSDEMLEGTLKSYFDGKGLDTSTMKSQNTAQELRQSGLNTLQKQDNRTYNPEQSMTGVA
jgi:hypothetical protein